MEAINLAALHAQVAKEVLLPLGFNAAAIENIGEDETSVRVVLKPDSTLIALRERVQDLVTRATQRPLALATVRQEAALISQPDAAIGAAVRRTTLVITVPRRRRDAPSIRRRAFVVVAQSLLLITLVLLLVRLVTWGLAAPSAYHHTATRDADEY